MRLPALRGTLAALVLAASLLATPVNAVGSYGVVATQTSTGVVGILYDFATVNIGFLDNTGAPDGSPQSTEAIILSFFGDGAVHAGDILLSNPSGSGIPGTSCTGTCTAGSTLTSAPAGTLDYTAPGGALTSLLRFIDTVPAYANGGPDGRFSVGEPLFFNLDAPTSVSPSASDRVLAGGAGVSGSPGAAPGTQSETVWDDTTECIVVDSGSVVGAYDALDLPVISEDTVGCAVGDPLVTVSGIKITGADAVFTPGVDEAFFSTASTIATGAYRITDGAGTAGSLVSCGVFGPVDGDCGTALFGTAPTNTKISMGSQAFTMPAGGIKSFDLNGNAFHTGPTANYDSLDRVVLDLDTDFFIGPADLNLNSQGSATFGAHPTLSGSPEVAANLPLTGLTFTMQWLDAGTLGQIESTEPLALHLGGAAAPLALGDICLTAVGGCASGTQRIGTNTLPTTGGTWTAVSANAAPGALWFADNNNNNFYDLGDVLYLHFGVGTVTAAGDYQLGSDSGGISRLTTGGTAIEPMVSFDWAAFDIDGSGGWTVGDLLYVDVDNGGGSDGWGGPGDVRVNTGTGVSSAGKNVKEGDVDAMPVLIDPAPAGALFSFRDQDGSGTVTPNGPDTIFLMPGPTGCPLEGTDVVLSVGSTALAGATNGGFASSITAGGATNCSDWAGPAFAYGPPGSFNKDSILYVDANGDTTQAAGNIAITASSGCAAGVRFVASATCFPAGTTLIPLGAPLGSRTGSVQIMVGDSSGNGLAAAGETVILDVDGNGLFTTGDVPLSTSTASSGGGGGGGGGGGSPPSPPTTPPTTPPDTPPSPPGNVTPPSTPPSNVTPPGTPPATPPGSLSDLADMNEEIADSLDVDRSDGVNTITWDDVGADFYQVWSADSPYVLEDELPGSQTQYVDEDGGAGTDYLVTACIGACTLTDDDVNDGDVPGHDGVPKGEDASKSKGFIPGPSPVLLVGLVALAALLVRRKAR